MKTMLRGALVGLLMLGTVGAAPALAEHKPGCTSRGNAGNNSNNATYSGSAPDAVADDSQGAPGDKVKMHGCGYQSVSNVDFDLNSDPIRLGSTTTDANGSFDVELTIPANAPVGRHTITATGVDPSGRAKVESVAYTVVAASAAQRNAQTTRSGTLPRTGSTTSTVPLVAGSTVLLGVGAVLVIAARRRKESSPA